jgi:hypothetical protein
MVDGLWYSCPVPCQWNGVFFAGRVLFDPLFCSWRKDSSSAPKCEERLPGYVAYWTVGKANFSLVVHATVGLEWNINEVCVSLTDGISRTTPVTKL